MTDKENKTIEVRGFLHLDKAFRKKYGTIPLIYNIEEPITGMELSKRLEVPPEEIEVIFVNGFVQSLDYMIHPGDRVAFLPPGCPGPYRIALGFYGKNQDNEANFKIIKKQDPIDMMHINVRLFANLRENRDKEMKIELSEGATIKDIIEGLNIPQKDAAILLVNGRGAKLDKILEDNDTVSIFPPLGGG